MPPIIMANLKISRRPLATTLAAAVLIAAPGLLASDKAAKPEPELISAIRSGDLARSRALLAHGAEVSARDAHGNTPLHFAAHEGIP